MTNSPRRELVDDDVFRRLCRVRDYLHEHHAERVTLDDLAKLSGVSRYHFLRLFHRTFGETPHAYLTKVRLERAKFFLARDEAPVTRICMDVGFSSLGSFSALFAERMGCPPSAWRRHYWQVTTRLERPALLFVPACFMDRYRAV